MVQKDFYRTREDGINLFRSYSTNNLKIRKIRTNEIYNEAIDIESSDFTYEETNDFIEDIE